MCSWHVAVPSDGPWARPLIIIEQEPQIPSRQSWSNAIGSRPSASSRSLTTSNISRNDISGLMSVASMSSNAPGASVPAWRQTRSLLSMGSAGPSELVRLLVAALREVDVLELERFLVERRCGVDALELPCGDVREVLVVAQRFALFGLVLHPKVAAARLLAGEGVEAEQLAELEEVGDAARLLERLVERRRTAGHAHVGVELLAQRGDVGERLLQRLLAACHPAVVPQDVAELAMEVVDRVLAVDRQEPLGLVGDRRLRLLEDGIVGRHR